MRCVTDYENAYRAVASRSGCILVDGPAVLRQLTQHGIIKDQVLHDAQHPTLRGYTALAMDIVEQLQGRRAFGWPPGTAVPRIEPAEVAKLAGMNVQQWVEVASYSRIMWTGARNYRFEEAERVAHEKFYGHIKTLIINCVPPERFGFVDALPPPSKAPPDR